MLVTGPTGSGKNTTLYAALSELNGEEVNICTVEDPVECNISGINQFQVSTGAGFAFSTALRSLLRQDPDIIMVGEVRDEATASISVQAALTGHLVLSTLHTNDAPSTVTRIIEIGVEPFLLAATLEAIVAQRLVRTICPKCKETYAPSEESLMELGLLPKDVEGKTFYYGRGCDQCNQTGYRGRTALYEIMKIGSRLREAIIERKSTAVLRAEAQSAGMRTLRDAGILKVFDGLTTIEEVVKQTLTFE